MRNQWNGDERRNYKENDIGWHQEYRRRKYDKGAMDSFCLHCGLRKEVAEKMSWKHFTLVVSIIGAIISTILALTVPAGVHGVEKLADNIQIVKEKVVELDVNQQIIIRRLNRHGKATERNDGK